MKTVPAGTEVSFAISGLSTFTGILNSRNQVEHVQTTIDNPVLGDMVVEASYTDYETAGSLSFPMHIAQKQGGHLSLEPGSRTCSRTCRWTSPSRPPSGAPRRLRFVSRRRNSPRASTT